MVIKILQDIEQDCFYLGEVAWCQNSMSVKSDKGPPRHYEIDETILPVCHAGEARVGPHEVIGQLVCGKFFRIVHDSPSAFLMSDNGKTIERI